MFWNSLYCVADELIAREYSHLRFAGRFRLPRACHVAHFSEFLGSVHVRTTWNTFVRVSTCAPRGPHLLECLRAHHVDHICWSVYVRTTWTTFVGVSTCAPRGPHLLDCLRPHHVDHICWSVYVRTTWTTFVAQTS